MFTRHRTITGGLLWVLIALASTLPAADAPDPKALAERIDQRLAAEWQKAKATPAETIDDATFLRRAYLDLVGRIPSVAETQAYLDDEQPNKRARLIDQLLSSGGHARHFATVWRRAWVPQTDTQEFASLTPEFENWAAVRLRDNVPYDRMVHELLTVSRVKPKSKQAIENVNPIGFLAASQFKPDNLAANTTRAFLGLNLDCAQCHDHPFARWTRDQFWETAAFFAPPTPAAEGMLAKLEVTIPDTTRKLGPALLDKQAPQWPETLQADTGRAVLARWITTRENPYFAKNAVNRLWAQVYGTGLVEPLDDLSEDNPASHPELLNDLAEAFTQSGFNLRYLTQAMLLTKTYQLSTVVEPGSPAEDLRLFARMPVRGLTGEQLYDSLRIAAGLPVVRSDLLATRGDAQRQLFATRLRIERAVDAERSIVQALSLMNGSLTVEFTTPGQSPTLAAATDSPFLNNQAKIDMLYFAALARHPSQQESSRLANYVDSGKEERSPQQSLSDIFWTLLNSSEFNTNH